MCACLLVTLNILVHAKPKQRTQRNIFSVPLLEYVLRIAGAYTETQVTDGNETRFKKLIPTAKQTDVNNQKCICGFAWL